MRTNASQRERERVVDFFLSIAAKRILTILLYTRRAKSTDKVGLFPGNFYVTDDERERNREEQQKPVLMCDWLLFHPSRLGCSRRGKAQYFGPNLLYSYRFSSVSQLFCQISHNLSWLPVRIGDRCRAYADTDFS